MNTITLALNELMIKKMKDFYEEWLEETDNPNLNFFVRLDECVILVYKTNKVVFQGIDAVNEAKLWGEVNEGWAIEYNHIGSDEVGTGDYFGPICVAAVYIANNDIKWLTSLGVQDSKKISDEKIMEIAPKLIAKLPYSQLALDNPKYNELTAKGFNMNKIKAYLHNQALNNVIERIKDKNIPIIMDQFAEEKLYYSYLVGQKNIVNNIKFMTKAESSSPAVAAASIIARYSFITKMEQIGHKYNLEIPKGAGFLVDTFGELFIKMYGQEQLSSIAKMNFKNSERIIDSLSRFKV